MTQSKATILHIDDNKDFLEFFHSLFEEYFNIVPSKNFDEALTILEHQKNQTIDAVIIDYEIPDKNGLEILKFLKTDYPLIPVIFYTGQGNEAVAREAFLSGASDYFVKDIGEFAHKEKLVNSINQAIARKKSDEAFRESEKKFRALFYNSSDSILLYQLDKDDFPHRYIEVNNAVCEKLGYDREELLGMNPRTIIAPEFIDDIPSLIKRLIREEKLFFEFVLINKKGERIPVEMSSHLFELDGKRVVVSTIRDITRRKQMEIQQKFAIQQLKNSRKMLTSLMANLPAMVYRCNNDEDLTMDFVSDGCLRITGYQPQDFLKKSEPLTYNSLIHNDDRGRVIEKIKESIKTHEDFRLRYRIKAANNQEKWVFEQGCGRFDGEGNLIALEGLITDITEYDSSYQALKKSEEKYRNLVETAKDIVFTCDLQGRITFVNSAFEKFFRKSAKEAFGTRLLDYVLADDRDMFRTSISKKVKTGGDSAIDFEARMTSRRGECHIMRFSCSPIKDAKGEVIGITGIGQDITEEKRTEQELINSNRELNDFAYMVSHELKSPLNIIKGYLMFIKQDPKMVAEYSDKLINQADQLITFVQNLLKLAAAGKVIGDKKNVNLDLLLRRIFSLQKHSDICAEMLITTPIPVIKGDPERLEVAFTNLIQNSIRYRDPVKQKLIIHISHRIEGKNFILSIKDNGLGISKKNINKIFNAAVSFGKENGTGFGLTLAKKIIEAHRGNIWADSRGKGMGVEFIIKIPYEENEQNGEANKAAVS